MQVFVEGKFIMGEIVGLEGPALQLISACILHISTVVRECFFILEE